MEGKLSLATSRLTGRMTAWRMIFLLAVAAILVRLAAASLRGSCLGFDESMYIILGRNLLSGHGYVLNDLPNATFPFLISLVAGLADAAWGPRWAVSLPSAVLGGAAVVPLYLLAKDMAGKTVAFAAAIAFVGFPALVHFSPFLSYGRILYEGSEHIYVFFFLFAAYFAWRAACDDRMRYYVAAGAFCGIASEVRQDALAYTAAAFVWLAGVAVARRRWSSMPRLGAYAAAALLAALPFVIQVKAVTGVWGTGPRFAKTFLMRETFGPVMASNNWKAALASYFRLNDDGTELETAYYGVSPWHRRMLAQGGEQVSLREMLSGLKAENVPVAWRGFHRWVAPDRFAIVTLIGLAAACLSARRWLVLSFFVTLVLPALATAMLLYPLVRFWMFLAPLVVLLFAWGAVFAAETVGARIPRAGQWPTVVALLAVGALTFESAYVSLAAQSRFRAREDFGRVMADLQTNGAEWLKANTAPGARVMASSPQPALMADRTWLALPIGEPRRVLAYARLKRADYILMATSGNEGGPAEFSGELVNIIEGWTRNYRVRIFVYDLNKAPEGPT